jgi:hypothetical protein
VLGTEYRRIRSRKNKWMEMSDYLETAEQKGYDIKQIVKKLKTLKIDEETRRFGVRMIRNKNGFVFWSDKGMMRLGPHVEKISIALILLTLGNKPKDEGTTHMRA